MRLGKVVFDVGYVVDLDNEKMVQQATDALYADMIHAYQYDEMSGWITTVVTGGLLESDIHDFLLEGDEDGYVVINGKKVRDCAGLHHDD